MEGFEPKKYDLLKAFLRERLEVLKTFIRGQQSCCDTISAEYNKDPQSHYIKSIYRSEFKIAEAEYLIHKISICDVAISNPNISDKDNREVLMEFIFPDIIKLHKEYYSQLIGFNEYIAIGYLKKSERVIFHTEEAVKDIRAVLQEIDPGIHFDEMPI